MKFKIMKKIFSVTLCTLIASASYAPPIKVSAALESIPVLGGCYGELRDAKREYIEQNPEDCTIYECHHLIAREALNKWGDAIIDKMQLNIYNEFLVDDLDQNWGPSIIMEKADHEKTLSYCNSSTRTQEQNSLAYDYINKQAQRLISYGDIMGILNDECDFIRSTFGHKYDRALREVWSYVSILQPRHNNGELIIQNPFNPSWFFKYRFRKVEECASAYRTLRRYTERFDKDLTTEDLKKLISIIQKHLSLPPLSREEKRRTDSLNEYIERNLDKIVPILDKIELVHDDEIGAKFIVYIENEVYFIH